ncbi:MAG: TrkA family potassium uptake protein [Dehalococcoidales bacterium]
MYIVVVGGGRVGYYLTKALLDEGHEVTVIEKEAVIVEDINEELGSICLRGDGCEAFTLAEVGSERADMLIAVTGDDEDNLVSCQVGKHKFNVNRTIARIRNPQNEALFKMLGIDVTISSTNVILEHIETELPTHPLTHLLEIDEAGQEIVEIKIPADGVTVGKSVRELAIPKGSKLALVISQGGKNRIPTSNTIIKAGDRVIALTTHDTEEELRSRLRGS